MTTSELAIAAWWQCCLAKCEHLFDFSPLCCCLAKCVHVIKTGCRPLSLSLSPACWHTCTRALISSQVAIKSCTAAKTAQIPPSMPGPWLARPPQALPLTGPPHHVTRGPIGLFASCRVFLQIIHPERGADRCLCEGPKLSDWWHGGNACERSQSGLDFRANLC